MRTKSWLLIHCKRLFKRIPCTNSAAVPSSRDDQLQRRCARPHRRSTIGPLREVVCGLRVTFVSADSAPSSLAKASVVEITSTTTCSSTRVARALTTVPLCAPPPRAGPRPPHLSTCPARILSPAPPILHLLFFALHWTRTLPLSHRLLLSHLPLSLFSPTRFRPSPPLRTDLCPAPPPSRTRGTASRT